MSQKLAGKVAVVTGASKGIGAGIARELAAQGASVVVNYSSSKAGADKVVQEITGQGGKAVGIGGSVSEPEDVKNLFAETKKAFGRVDVLVNNAGISHHSAFRDTDPEVVRRVMGVNFFGAVYCTKAALESVIARKGQIIAISSIAGFSPLLHRTAYSASKHAMHGFFEDVDDVTGARAEYRWKF